MIFLLVFYTRVYPYHTVIADVSELLRYQLLRSFFGVQLTAVFTSKGADFEVRLFQVYVLLLYHLFLLAIIVFLAGRNHGVQLGYHDGALRN